MLNNPDNKHQFSFGKLSSPFTYRNSTLVPHRFGQRSEVFSGGGILLELFEFSALFGGCLCHVGIDEGFLVGVFGAVAGSFVSLVAGALHDCPRRCLQQIFIGVGELVQLTHTLSQRTHRIDKAAILETSIYFASGKSAKTLGFQPFFISNPSVIKSTSQVAAAFSPE